MRALVAMDSFKGALDQTKASAAVARGLIAGGNADWTVDVCPMADGGDGSGLLLEGRGGSRQLVDIVDVFGRPVLGWWVLFEDVALVESAVGSGYVTEAKRPQVDAFATTSRGTGQLLRAALEDARVREVWVGLGGTGSIDGGAGLLEALGGRFITRQGHLVGNPLEHAADIDRLIPPPISKPIVGLADVWVPLVGDNGAVQQFGPQKGFAPEELPPLESAMTVYARQVDAGHMQALGAGSAGGIGFALLALGARLVPGARWWSGVQELDKRVAAADVVVTGEGGLDQQSLMGKVVSVVLDVARRHQKPVVIVAGAIPDLLEPFYQQGVWLVWPLSRGPESLAEALVHTEQRLVQAGDALGRLFRGMPVSYQSGEEKNDE